MNRALGSLTSTPGEVLDYKPKDLVEFYRPPNKKDVSGWMGPARVLENLPDRGQVKIMWNGQELYVRYPDIRRYHETAAMVYGVMSESVNVIQRHIQQMAPSTIETYGYAHHNEKWILTAASKTHRQVLLAVEHHLRTVLHYSGVIAARIGRGIPRFPACADARRSVLLWWDMEPAHPMVFYMDSVGAVSTTSIVGSEWPKYKYMQLLLSDHSDFDLHGAIQADPAHNNDQDDDSNHANGTNSQQSDPDRLTTIDEGVETDGSYVLVAGGQAAREEARRDCVSHPGAGRQPCETCDPEAAGEEASWDCASHPGTGRQSCEASDAQQLSYLMEELDRYMDDHIDEHQEEASVDIGKEGETSTETCTPALHFHAAGADPSALYQPDEDAEGNKYVEILCPDDAAKLLMDKAPPAGTCARLRCYLSGVKKAVIDRDTDLLTASEYTENAALVRAAVHEELKTWVAHECFSRKPRKHATNIIDVKWVGKWKHVKSATDPTKTVRVIRMRLTLRGFKDRDADGLVTYSGTASRLAQKLTISEACVRGWPLTAIDIRKAFLKGLTYDEMARETGEPRREVNFDLDAESVKVLRTIKGFESFDPVREVLHNDKPGTGFKDAPRCFSLKLAKATKGLFKAQSLTHDDQLLVKHNLGQLIFIATIHVDDIKVACTALVLVQFIKALTDIFGVG